MSSPECITSNQENNNTELQLLPPIDGLPLDDINTNSIDEQTLKKLASNAWLTTKETEEFITQIDDAKKQYAEENSVPVDEISISISFLENQNSWITARLILPNGKVKKLSEIKKWFNAITGPQLEVTKQGKKYDYGLKIRLLLGIPIPEVTIKKHNSEVWNLEWKIDFKTLFTKSQHLSPKLTFSLENTIKGLEVTKKPHETLVQINHDNQEPNTNIHISSVNWIQQVVIYKEWQGDVFQAKKWPNDTQRSVWTNDGTLSTMTDEEINASIFSTINEKFDEALQKSQERTNNYLKSLADKEKQEKTYLEDPATLYE